MIQKGLLNTQFNQILTQNSHWTRLKSNHFMKTQIYPFQRKIPFVSFKQCLKYELCSDT